MHHGAIVMSRKEWTEKITIIIAGSIIAAYGITLAMYAGFGGATLAVLWQGISGTFHISIGTASMIVAIIMILFAFFYDRSQIHVGTILYQIVYSFCVDLFADAHVYSTHLWVNAMIMLLGIIFFAIGTGLYAAASLGRGSYEALTFSLAEKNVYSLMNRIGVHSGIDICKSCRLNFFLYCRISAKLSIRNKSKERNHQLICLWNI